MINRITFLLCFSLLGKVNNAVDNRVDNFIARAITGFLAQFVTHVGELLVKIPVHACVAKNKAQYRFI